MANLAIADNQQVILVFKTNVKRKSEITLLEPILNIPEILKWNIDLEDCDKVLRIVTHKLTSKDIVKAAKAKGFECAELE